MFYLIMAASVLICIIAPTVMLIRKISGDKISKYVKILSIVLFCVFFVRYLSYISKLDFITLSFKGHSSLQSPSLSKAAAVFAYITEWLSVMAVVLLVLKPFFNVRTLDRLVHFFVPVYIIVAAVSVNYFNVLSIGGEIGKLNLSLVLFAAETGIVVFLTGYYWAMSIKASNIPLIKDLKSAGIFVLALFLCLIFAFPNYTRQFFFGVSNRTAENVLDFRLNHRILLYGAVILPITAYFALRNLPLEIKRFSLIYFSLVAMCVYCYDLDFYKLFTNPESWPLHLCNTAMFLVPICLVFRTQKLFYFTYFINVYGAMMAILMPNYSNTTLLSASSIYQFWYNHYIAFFMPLLLVALRLFDRPNIKQFRYSIAGFCMYFIFALLMDIGIAGFSDNVFTPDYFFLAGDHIAGTLGNWAMKIFDINLTLHLFGHSFLFKPVYQSLFFGMYIVLGLGMWFIYELGFSLADAHGALTAKRKKIKLDQIALMATLNGRSIEEPMNKDAGIKLELKHFSKKYATSKQYAVNDANLEVYGGEIFGFLGPNGAGKSTIIKSIVGIQPITEGSIEICGYDCEKQPVQAKSLIGYVPDHYALYEKLTGREYINYIADIYGVSKEDRNERIEKHIKMFELQGAIDNPIKTYSHGMKQKITIMAALVHDPKLWILDEPLTGLDPNSIYQVKECMKEHAAKGNIVFFSSHIIDVVERICDRITIIKKGQILVTRDVADIEKEGLLEDFYLRTIGEKVTNE